MAAGNGSDMEISGIRTTEHERSGHDVVSPVASADSLLALFEVLPGPEAGPFPGGIADALADIYLLTARDGTVLAANRRGVDHWQHGSPRGAAISEFFLEEERSTVQALLLIPPSELVRRSLFLRDAREVDVALLWRPSGSGMPTGQWLLRPVRDASRLDDPRLPVATYACRVRETWECLCISPRLRDLAGLSPDDWTSDPNAWLEAVDPADRERLIEARLQATAAGTVMSCRYRLRTRDGGVAWVRDEAVVDQSGLARGIISDASIDRRRDEVFVKLHEGAAQHVQHLRAVMESTNLLFQAYAHDIRSMALGVRSVLRSGDLHLRGEAGCAAVDPEVVLGRIVDLAGGVIALQGRPQPLVPRPIQVAEIVAAALEQVDGRGYEVAVEVDDSKVLVDAAVVERILVSLLGNAIRHTPEGTRIIVWGRRTEDAVVIAVEDDGPGLPVDLPGGDVFAPLTRGSDDGLGLGLSFARRLAQLHGGDLTAENLPGGGVCFVVRLPQPVFGPPVVMHPR